MDDAGAGVEGVADEVVDCVVVEEVVDGFGAAAGVAFFFAYS